MKGATLLPLTALTTGALASVLPSNPLTERQQCNGIAVTNRRTVPASTGLHQLSHPDLPPGGLTAQTSEYIFPPDAGAGTCAWSIDTGVKPNHNEYAPRLVALWDCIGAADRLADNPFASNYGCVQQVEPYPVDFDGNGHGTHTSATILGTQYGVAPAAKLIGIRALNAQGGGVLADVVSAIKLATFDAAERSVGARPSCPLGTACNLSLGVGLPFSILTLLDPTSDLHKAVNEAAAKGLFCAVAAGNSDQPVEIFTPANALDACTVGALDEANEKACFSNFGSAVDVWATGVRVLSAWINGTDGSVSSSFYQFVSGC